MKKMQAMGVLVIVIAVVVVGVLSFCTTTVPTGYTGILVTFGRVENTTLEAGFHIKSPFQSVVKMDNRTQKASNTDQAFSSDIQEIQVVYSLNFNIDKANAMNLYRTVGVNYYDTVVLPRLRENLKAVFTKYTADRLIANREIISTQVTDDLRDEMKQYGINVLSVSIEDLDFAQAFTDAVEAKQVAEQTKLRINIEQEQQTNVQRAEAERLTISVEAEATQRKVRATAEAEAERIAADADAYSVKARAEAEAEANKQVAASLTPALIEKLKNDRWNGTVPGVVLGEGNTPFIQVPQQ